MIFESQIHCHSYVEIYLINGSYEGYPTCNVYFTTDKDISFMLPWPGHEWETEEIDLKAQKLPDREYIGNYRPVKKWIFLLSLRN